MAEAIFGDPDLGLGRFSGDRLSDCRARLSEADDSLIKSYRGRLRRALYDAAAPPRGVGTGPKCGWTEMALLFHETQKKKSHLGPRLLIRRAASALLALKPCWMMSPTAVSQYIED